MKKVIFLFIIATSVLLAQKVDTVGGYLNLAWDTPREEVKKKMIEGGKTKDAGVIRGIYIRSANPDRFTTLDIYHNPVKSIAYYCFFYNNMLYRVDIANYDGYIFEKRRDIYFYDPVSKEQVNKLFARFKKNYGDPYSSEQNVYNDGPTVHRAKRYWWMGNKVTAILEIKEDYDYRDMFIFRITLMTEKVLKAKKTYDDETSIADSLGF